MDQITLSKQQSPDHALTAEGLEELQTDLLILREKRARISEDGTAQEERHFIDARITTLEEILNAAWIVDPATLEQGVVAIGMHVELRDVDTTRSERYLVVGKHEPLRPGELSAASAVGRALIGRRVGETLSVDLPNGHARRLEVVSVLPRPST
jgi:transcription elongation factor GreA